MAQPRCIIMLPEHLATVEKTSETYRFALETAAETEVVAL